MIDAIVTSLDRENLLVTPSGNADINEMVGRRAVYIDKSGRVWEGKVKAAEEPFVSIKFEDFPTGIGQGQIVEILEDSEEIPKPEF